MEQAEQRRSQELASCRAERLRERAARTERRKRLQSIRRGLIVNDPHCWYCGVEVCMDTSSLDHLEPRGRGGPDDVANLRLCCRRCNERKADIPLRYFVCRLERGTGLVRLWDAEVEK